MDHSIESPSQPIINPEIPYIRKLFNAAIDICTPFSFYYNKLEVKEVFYFPQRFLSPAIIGFAAFVYILTVILIYSQDVFNGYIIQKLIIRLETLKINIHKTAYSFVSIASDNALLFKQALRDTDLQPIENLISEINNQFDDIINAIYIGFLYSFC